VVTTGFYIDTKTKRVRGNVERLQQRVDSIKAVLNNKTYTAISANRELLDANPAYAQGGEMQAEVTGRDKMVQAAIFGELTKNLEASKTALLQETPTIQVVDTPEMPLKKNEVSWLLALIAGTVVTTFITALYLFIKAGKL
jgi:capsule polysaccharide export protein KpsE/RkpR